MKKHFIFLITALLCISLLTACGSNNNTDPTDAPDNSESESEISWNEEIKTESELEFKLSEDRKYYTVVGKGSYPDKDVIIPEFYEKKPVIAIGDGAFAGTSGIVSITVPAKVTTIGANAFSQMPDLKTVTLADGVTDLGEKAFFACPELESVSFGNTITKIKKSTFEDCEKLAEINIPDTITEIEHSAFYSCGALKTVTGGKALKKVGASAFDKTALYLDDASWSDGQLYIGNILVKIKPDKAGALTVKDGTTIIADHAANMTEITEITCPASLKIIGDSAFAACSKLETVKLNEGIEVLGTLSFASCDAIINIAIPNTVKEIRESAFFHCSELKSIVIPDTITAISPHVFNECASLKDVTLPKDLKEIGEYGFANCHSITYLEFPETLEVIKENAFYKAYNLVSVNLPKSLKSIGDSAFLYCFKLLDVVNESSLTITPNGDDNGKAGKYMLELSVGGRKVDYVDGFIFYTHGETNYLIGYEGAAKDVVLPDSYKGQQYKVYKYALAYHAKIESIKVSEGVTAIGSNAFNSCLNLKEITLTKKITAIASSTFSVCSKLETVKYTGTEAEFSAITVSKTNNQTFINAKKVYNVT